ncbi:hypothetical protein Hc94105_1298 [Helicobacter cinaedi]|nr:hypothetical protein [Helicobacter cinaedi]BDB67087.1 hypothetical protein Hc94105_1298 [Helicobacter cinaedi]
MLMSNIAYHIDGQPMFKILDEALRLEREGKEILHLLRRWLNATF